MKLYIDTKPTLEWENTIDHWWYAVSDYGTYVIKIHEWISDDINLQLYQWQDVIAFHSVHKSVEAAKAAAQADYEQRTAERFREVEVPEPLPDKPTILTAKSFINGYNCAVGDIHTNIQSAIGAGEGQP